MSNNKDLEQSQELAKQTLDWLKSNKVKAVPSHYSVGYEHLSGQNPGLSFRLSQFNSHGDRLEVELDKLYQEHFGSHTDERLEEFRAGLQQILQQVLSLTERPQAETQHFHQTLVQSKEILSDESTDLDGVLGVIQHLVIETQRMDDSICAMETELRQTNDEVSLLKEQYDQVRSEVFTDPLTGVSNRRGLDSALRKLTADGTQQPHLSVLMIDLDNFKPFNDKHGHLVGDQVLCFAAKILKNATRGSDLISRYGGDEFAVILPDTNTHEAKTVAFNILKRFQSNTIKRRSSREVLGTLSASVGVAELHPDETIEEMMERADRGLFASKRNGRNQVTALPKL
ncbi:GGDEF domain-containing protein [Motiliproteus coralliicola]|uniref:diguanylate cyclase n=1 Tax=Motiliproteus coralliicola TaxID=2283196 RepID=A0A369WRB5_9GAMM|nr:GGDEF domain-containing protein [Motiliproteus coralliicola]RDE24232.1 GGDEF domain-containing protein [Motiliproteus coralliicola]